MRARHIGQRGPSRRDTMRPHGPQTQRWPHGRNAWSRRARRQTQQGAPANSSSSVSELIGFAGAGAATGGVCGSAGAAAGGAGAARGDRRCGCRRGDRRGCWRGDRRGRGDRWRRRRRVSWNKSGDAALLRLARHDVAAHAERAAREV